MTPKTFFFASQNPFKGNRKSVFWLQSDFEMTEFPSWAGSHAALEKTQLRAERPSLMSSPVSLYSTTTPPHSEHFSEAKRGLKSTRSAAYCLHSRHQWDGVQPPHRATCSNGNKEQEKQEGSEEEVPRESLLQQATLDGCSHEQQWLGFSIQPDLVMQPPFALSFSNGLDW